MLAISEISESYPWHSLFKILYQLLNRSRSWDMKALRVKYVSKDLRYARVTSVKRLRVGEN